MAVYYFDTSALVKLYLEEEGSERVLELTDNPDENSYALLDLARVEFRSALRRREREGELAREDVADLIKQLDKDLEEFFLTQPVSPPVIEGACRLLDLHALRSADSLQLAGCLILQEASGSGAATLVCADVKLGEVAALEGLSVVNPIEGG